MERPLTESEITALGNPGCPTGEAGAQMLQRMNRSHAAVTAWGLSFLALSPDDRVLDIGCGGGAALHMMAQRVTEGHLTGIDRSETAAAQSRLTNAAEIAQGKTDICTGDAAALPFPDGAFTKAVTVESFYFWPDPQENLREVRRVLAPGGRFALIADIHGRDNLPAEILENIRRYHLFNPTPQEYRTLLENAGFTGVQVHLKSGTEWICAEGSVLQTGALTMEAFYEKLRAECGVRPPQPAEQDWEWCAGECSHTGEYLTFYEEYAAVLDSRQKYLLINLIVQGIEDLMEQEADPGQTDRLWCRAKAILLRDDHRLTIGYWSCGEQDLADCWEITPRMRELL